MNMSGYKRLIHCDNVTMTSTSESSDNITSIALSCAYRSIEDPVIVTHLYSAALNTTLRSFQALFYIIVFLLGISINLLVIVLVAKYEKLRTRSILFVLQIIVLNLVYTSTLFLIRPITAIADKWLFSEAMCTISGFLSLCYNSVRLFLMIVFTLDRFLAVFFSFNYPKRSSKFILLASIATWTGAIVFRSIGMSWGLDCYGHVPTFHMCSFLVFCNEGCLAYAYSSLVLLFLPAIIIPMVIYSLLFCKARRIKKTTSSESSAMQIHKEEWKTTITFFQLFLIVAILILPHYFSLVAIYSSFDVPPVAWHVYLAILQVGSTFPVVVDPIVVLCNQDFRATLLEVFASVRQKSSSIGYQREEDEEEQKVKEEAEEGSTL